MSLKNAYEQVVEQQVQANTVAATTRLRRLAAWNHLADLAVRHFNQAEKAAAAGKWFDNLYVLRNNDLRIVQMHMGTHPVKRESDGSLTAEHGATVAISQNHMGSVIILLYPYESSLQRRNVPHLVWELTDEPMTIKASTVVDLVRDFMTYARVSSALLAPSESDRKRIEVLERRSLVLQGKLPAFYLGSRARIALGFGSFFLLCIFANWLRQACTDTTPSQVHEPLAGLIALVTGWLAAFLKEESDARWQLEVTERMDHALADAGKARSA
ncbi:hypothetical protein [Piscinibacter sp. HJYY11]|uniref:hypothetical protein n=1 Tax=Piscinibacter sp. HJYY11 TaxID=2801333 RepID=UPI00191E4439|nr:hypothetical protein [Piscinibacter sp. HJYY11]MBL0729420.1 hypothetical protein [Piscinibacter sp. HJYY11]